MILSKRPDIERFLARPEPPIRAAVIYGRDTGVVRDRGLQLARKLVPNLDDPFDVALLTDGDLDSDGARLEGELAAQSLMGGRRLVRLRFATEKTALDKQVAETLVAHAEGKLNPDAFFIVEAGNLGRDSALRKAAEKAAEAVAIPCYEDEPGDVARLVREVLARDQVSLNADALQIFVARLPRERGLMRQEIERLVLYIGPGSGRTIDTPELEEHLGVEPDASLSDAALQAFGGRPGPAQSGLRRALAEGESAVMAVRMAAIHLGKLRRINVLQAAGAGAKEAAKAAGVFWKQEAEILRQTRAWRLELLDEVQDSINTADIATKTTGLPEALIAERLLLEIAARAKRMGL